MEEAEGKKRKWRKQKGRYSKRENNMEGKDDSGVDYEVNSKQNEDELVLESEQSGEDYEDNCEWNNKKKFKLIVHGDYDE